MAELSGASGGIRPVAIVVDPTEAKEAEGVLIRRTIGSERLVLLDPLLLLDHLQVTLKEGEDSVGFPRHPHRGIETLTYVLSGKVHHKDSLGNDSGVGANGSQWMTAGSGIFHAEMLERTAADSGPIEALQLWFNLPAAKKMTDPQYQPATESEIPVVTLPNGATIRVVAGSYSGKQGAFAGIAVSPTCLDVTLPVGSDIVLEAPTGTTAISYLYRGKASFGQADGAKEAEEARLIIFGEGDLVSVRNDGESAARFFFVSAPPLNEPVLQYRSLVLNNADQMREAIRDLEQGTFAR